MALGDFHSRIQSPIVAMYRYCAIVTCPERPLLPLFFFVRKFLQLPVQVPMGSLTRPVTTHHAHDDAGTQEYCRDDQCDLHIKYICYGCWPRSCCNNSWITRWISDCMCPISVYTTRRCSWVTYSNWCSNSHMFMYSICNSSRSSNTAKVLRWNATAHTVMATYRMTARVNIRLFTCATAGWDPPDRHPRHRPAPDHTHSPEHRVCDQPLAV